MKSFDKYWKEKSAKRRKSWSSKAMRKAESHLQYEEIRNEVYIPLDFIPNFSFDGYLVDHYATSNPIALWTDKGFSFSEEGLRDALKEQGADMSGFRMSVNRESIKGKEAPEPDISSKYNDCYPPNKVYDFERNYHSWLKRRYQNCTDKETVRLSYGEVSMTINRYSTEGLPFGYYEINPCEQLTRSPMLLQETDFYTLNVATLLMEAAAEWELRREEFNYYAKNLKLRSMEAAITDSVEFTLWDDSKLEKKVEEYIGKGYPLGKILDQVRRPWKNAVDKFFASAAEREVGSTVKQEETFKYFDSSWSISDRFIEKKFLPYLEGTGKKEYGVEDAEVIVHEGKMSFTVMFHGYGCRIKSEYYHIFLEPDISHLNCRIELFPETPLSAVAAYLKLMPSCSRKIDEAVVKVMRIYDRHADMDEKRREDIAFLENLALRNKGKPVGKMMESIRWNGGGFTSKNSPVQSIRIINDYSFCHLVKHVPHLVTSANGVRSVYYADEEVQRWLDPSCSTVYDLDPDSDEFKESGKRYRKWNVSEFIHAYFTNSESVLSSDFIDKNL